MKKYILLVLMCHSCYFLQLFAQEVELLQVVKEEVFDLSKGAPLFDMEGNMVGYRQNLEEKGKLVDSFRSKISVDGWTDFVIDRFMYVVIDKKNGRLITYGSPAGLDVVRTDIHIAIYSENGSLIVHKESIIYGDKNNIVFSNNGDIYIAGKDSTFQETIYKINTSGKMEWSIPLVQNVRIKGIGLSNDGLSLAVLQSNNENRNTSLEKNGSTITYLSSKGVVYNSFRTLNNFNYLNFLGPEKVLLSNGYHLITHDLIDFKTLSNQHTTQDRIVRMERNQNENNIINIILITAKNKASLYNWNNEKLEKVKQFDLASLHINRSEILQIKFKNNTLRLLTKNKSFFLN